MEIYKEFTVEAAHSLPNVPRGHRCSGLHGHSYKVTVHVAGEVDEANGWVMDFNVLKAAFEPVQHQLNHRYLNDVEGLENPTSEAMARWIWQRIKPGLPGLSKVVVKESDTSGCIYRGEDEAPAA